jgi:hypothetical protein
MTDQSVKIKGAPFLRVPAEAKVLESKLTQAMKELIEVCVGVGISCALTGKLSDADLARIMDAQWKHNAVVQEFIDIVRKCG